MTTTPEWFTRALDTPMDTGRARSAGAEINWAAWGDAGNPGIVFIHGGGANLHWYRGSVPLLARRYRVAAFDLSGHGDSDRRPEYGAELWADEVLSVATAAGISGPLVLVAHSMGGFVAVRTAADHSEKLRGLIILDSPIMYTDLAGEAAGHARRGFAAGRNYTDRATATARFRTIPEQAHYLPFIQTYVAERSVAPRDGGWEFKTDMAAIIYPGPEHGEHLRRVRCDVAMIRAGDGMVGPEVKEWFVDRLGRQIIVDVVPGAGHHMMLDKPVEMLSAIEKVLAAWGH